MALIRFAKALPVVTKKLFHKRSIIIVSQQQTNHISISGSMQLFGMLAIIGVISWGSFVTGGYVSARSVIEKKDAALKSVANSRVDNNFHYIGATLQPQNIAPVATLAGSKNDNLEHSVFSSAEPEDLYQRIAFLETRVNELKSANAEIIHVVKEKTNGKIADLETVIRKTGLDPATLKKRVNASTKKDAQGGPFIPAEILQSGAVPRELFAPLEKLSTLNRIVELLPLSYPIRNFSPQSTFGNRVDPFTGRLAFHAGIDLSGPAGSSVLASGNGKVVDASYNGAYGNMIDISHGNGIVTRYGHLSKILVKEGQMVKTGQQIGVQGSTGRSTGAHLHYEVRYNNRPINPNNFLKAGLYVSQR